MHKLLSVTITAMIVMITCTAAIAQGGIYDNIGNARSFGNEEFGYTFDPEAKDEIGQSKYSLLFKRIMLDVSSGNTKDLIVFIDVTSTDSLEKAYRFAVSEGQAEVVKTLDKALVDRNPKLFRSPDPLREELIVNMMMEQQDLEPKIAKRTCVGSECSKVTDSDKRTLEVIQKRQANNDSMIVLLLSLGARGDRVTYYHGPARLMDGGRSTYGGQQALSLVEWAAKIEKSESKHLDAIAKTVPGTEDGLKALRKACPNPDRNSAVLTKNIRNILDPHIIRVIDALKLAGVEKDLSDDDRSFGITAR